MNDAFGLKELDRILGKDTFTVVAQAKKKNGRHNRFKTAHWHTPSLYRNARQHKFNLKNYHMRKHYYSAGKTSKIFFI